MSRNYKLTIQYDGTDFHGWQFQTNLRTVQGELSDALSLIEGQPVTLHGSGRTDAGVHAEGQVGSVVLERDITPERLRAAVNANVGSDVRVMKVTEVDDSFHARYSAQSKTYVYRVINSSVISPFWRRYAHEEARKLDLNRMQSCAKLFLGTHEWSAFSSGQSDVVEKNRTITDLTVAQCADNRAGANLISIRVSANGFLRYMVRTIAGALLVIGRGELDQEAVGSAIEHGVRSSMIVTAPASGLTLLAVHYDRQFH
ncbi:MAG: tRNA pseudouridine(38-40) synthase TruA [Pyrinomonadaceae bacterium]